LKAIVRVCISDGCVMTVFEFKCSSWDVTFFFWVLYKHLDGLAFGSLEHNSRVIKKINLRCETNDFFF